MNSSESYWMTRSGRRKISSTTLGRDPGTCGSSLDPIGMWNKNTLYYKNEIRSNTFRFPITETLAVNPIPNFPYPIHTAPVLHNSQPTLTSLPPDILLSTCEFLPIRSIYALITTCKKLRSTILPHANPIARRRLINDEPWYLPAGPFALNLTTTKVKPYDSHGGEEIEWWADQWGAGGIAQEDMDTKIPWFTYRKECSKSMSMWNRKRIWGISRQLDALARVKGLL
jgi:hypothetical protein